MSDEIIKAEIVPVMDAQVVLLPVMNLKAAKDRLKEFQEFVREYLVEGEDFGTIPGTPKPTLYKPGADKLCDIYGLADTYTWTKVENWQLDPPLFDYEVTCTLTSRRDQRLIGSGMGSCNSWESRYKFREGKRKCPLCHQETIFKSTPERGGGFYCWSKKGGCGGKFLDTDKSITEQQVGKAINDDIPTLKNTILKMAKKRAKVDAVLSVTRSSGIFTQDVEDIVDQSGDTGQGSKASAERAKEAALDKLLDKMPDKKVIVTSEDVKASNIGKASVGQQLTVVQVGEDAYHISGDAAVMDAHKELLFSYGKRGMEKGKPAPWVAMTAEGLAAFRYQFEDQRHNKLVALKATWGKP